MLSRSGRSRLPGSGGESASILQQRLSIEHLSHEVVPRPHFATNWDEIHPERSEHAGELPCLGARRRVQRSIQVRRAVRHPDFSNGAVRTTQLGRVVRETPRRGDRQPRDDDHVVADLVSIRDLERRRIAGWSALRRRNEEPGIARVRLERDEFETDEAPLNERQGGKDRLCAQEALALENEDGGVPVGAEVGFTDDAGLVEVPECAGFVLEVRRESGWREAGRFDFECEDLHGWLGSAATRNLTSLALSRERRVGQHPTSAAGRVSESGRTTLR